MGDVLPFCSTLMVGGLVRLVMNAGAVGEILGGFVSSGATGKTVEILNSDPFGGGAGPKDMRLLARAAGKLANGASSSSITAGLEKTCRGVVLAEVDLSDFNGSPLKRLSTLIVDSPVDSDKLEVIEGVLVELSDAVEEPIVGCSVEESECRCGSLEFETGFRCGDGGLLPFILRISMTELRTILASASSPAPVRAKDSTESDFRKKFVELDAK